jgi:hypothetical protein
MNLESINPTTNTIVSSNALFKSLKTVKSVLAPTNIKKNGMKIP